YLRGSLPRGEAVEGISDIDSFAVIHGEGTKLDLNWIRPFETDIRRKYPFVANVEFHFFPYDTLLHSPTTLTRRFIIEALSLCIYGEDLSPQIQRFKPTLAIAYAFHGQIQRDVDTAKQGFRDIRNPPQIRQGCTWIMKRLLRTGFCLFMQEEN